jgi:hypothetical protein
MKTARRLLALILCLSLLTAHPAAAHEQGDPLPCPLQLTLLSKVLSFDRTLSGHNGVVEVAVLYQGDYPQSEAAKSEFMRATRSFANANGIQLRFKAVQLEGNQNFRDVFASLRIDAVYVMPLRALDVGDLARAAAAAGVRTFSGMPDYVYEGIGVTVGNKAGRPAVYINLQTARAQGSDFSSQLLKLANVID